MEWAIGLPNGAWVHDWPQPPGAPLVVLAAQNKPDPHLFGLDEAGNVWAIGLPSGGWVKNWPSQAPAPLVQITAQAGSDAHLFGLDANNNLYAIGLPSGGWVKNWPKPLSNNSLNWLSFIPDSIQIGDINLPGTHDSAAINLIIPTPYACHKHSITDQLCGGIRLLDVRLKVNKNDTQYAFATCHGDLGSSTGFNEYQSFPSLLQECKTFLTANGSEMIVMSLKVDDWNGYGFDQDNVLNALYALIYTYPITCSKDMQTLGEVRGRIVLYNRINDDLRFGVPVHWDDNTPGSLAQGSPHRSFGVYVQDQYRGLPTFGASAYKLNLVTSAIDQSKARQLLSILQVQPGMEF